MGGLRPGVGAPRGHPASRPGGGLGGVGPDRRGCGVVRRIRVARRGAARRLPLRAGHLPLAGLDGRRDPGAIRSDLPGGDRRVLRGDPSLQLPGEGPPRPGLCRGRHPLLGERSPGAGPFPPGRDRGPPRHRRPPAGPGVGALADPEREGVGVHRIGALRVGRGPMAVHGSPRDRRGRRRLGHGRDQRDGHGLEGDGPGRAGRVPLRPDGALHPPGFGRGQHPGRRRRGLGQPRRRRVRDRRRPGVGGERMADCHAAPVPEGRRPRGAHHRPAGLLVRIAQGSASLPGQSEPLHREPAPLPQPHQPGEQHPGHPGHPMVAGHRGRRPATREGNARPVVRAGRRFLPGCGDRDGPGPPGPDLGDQRRRLPGCTAVGRHPVGAPGRRPGTGRGLRPPGLHRGRRNGVAGQPG